MNQKSKIVVEAGGVVYQLDGLERLEQACSGSHTSIVRGLMLMSDVVFDTGAQKYRKHRVLGEQVANFIFSMSDEDIQSIRSGK